MGVEQQGWKPPEWERDWIEAERHLGRGRQSELAGLWDRSPKEVRTYLNATYLLGNPDLTEGVRLSVKLIQIHALTDIFRNGSIAALCALEVGIAKVRNDTGRHKE